MYNMLKVYIIYYMSYVICNVLYVIGYVICYTLRLYVTRYMLYIITIFDYCRGNSSNVYV